MEKKKLKLANIKIESFVTTLGKENKKTIKGARDTNTIDEDTLHTNCLLDCTKYYSDVPHECPSNPCIVIPGVPIKIPVPLGPSTPHDLCLMSQWFGMPCMPG